MKECELFQCLEKFKYIENVSIEDLALLLGGSETDTYSIKMTTSNSIILFNKNTQKHESVKCVKNYFDVKKSDCYDIKDELDLFSSADCKACLSMCLDLYNNNKINKIK